MRFAKVQQQGQAVGLRGFALQLIHLHFQCVVFTAKLLVVARSILQSKIVIPGVAQATDAMRTGAFKRRKCSDGPDTNQAAFGIALDLQREHQDLQQHDARKQKDRFVARGYADHWFENPEFVIS